ncbi:MAG: OsmC family peroxiredoxin [Gemmatimonadetes bacterium]|nr:OsmC family peroxiredoxin [Gemmatimonadota bacterium]
MIQRNATAQWTGDLKAGQGSIRLGSGAFEGKYSFGTRFEGAPGTNPEELLGAAHAGCFSMALALGLTQAGHVPTRVHTTATVQMDRVAEKMTIIGIALVCEAEVPGIGNEAFQQVAEATKSGCIVSRALASVPMTLTATLK